MKAATAVKGRLRSTATNVASALRRPLLSHALVALAVVLLLTGSAIGQPGILASAAYLMLIACALSLASSARTSYLAMMLLACFALFLMSRPALSAVFRYPPGETDNFGINIGGSAVSSHVFLALGMALLGLFIGFQALAPVMRSFLNRKNDTGNKPVVEAVRRSSLLLFAAALPMKIALDVEIIRFVVENGYLAYYAEFETSLPSPLRILGGTTNVAFLLYLATNPSVRALRLPTGFYLAEAFLSLGTGQRTEFFLSVSVLVLYFAYRYLVHEPTELRFSTRLRWGAVLTLPLLLTIATVVARLRAAPPRPGTGPLSPLLDTLHSQGASLDVLAYGYLERSEVSESNVYTFGPLVNLVTRNLPGAVGFGPGPFAGHTTERAMESGYFSHQISYLVLNERYFDGLGLGSSYVAELWQDFSYAGVLIGSVILALIVAIMTAGLQRTWWTRALALMLGREILLIPRSGATQFLVEAFTLSAISGVILIAIGATALMYSRSRPIRRTRIPTPRSGLRGQASGPRED